MVRKIRYSVTADFVDHSIKSISQGVPDDCFLHHLMEHFVTNNAAKIQLEILEQTFRLTSGPIVNAKSLRYAGSVTMM